MTWTIAFREIRDHVLSLRFYLGFALCLVLMVAGTLVLAEEQGQRRENLAPYLDQDQYRSVTEWANANWLMNGSLFLARPLPPLRSIVYGLHNSSFLAQVKGANYVLYQRAPLVGNPLPALFASFDVLFVVGVVLSLLALVFSYDGLAGEREEGTLRLVLAYPIGRGEVLMGKWLGAFIALAVLFTPCFIVVIFVGASHALIAFVMADLWALLGMYAGCLLYMGVFISLGLLVSVHSSGTGVALARALVVWALAIWIVPSFAPYVAAALSEGKPALMVEANISRTRFTAEREGWAEVARFIRDRGWGEHEEANWNLDWGTWSDAVPRLQAALADEADKMALAALSTEVMRAQLAEMEEVAARLKAGHMRDRHREVKLGQMLACLSPLGPLTFMLTDLAGTGVAGEFHFRAGVERFKGDLVAYLHRQLAERSMWEQVEAESFPYFTYRPEVEKAGAEVLVYPLILLLYAIGFFLAAYLRFARAEI